MNGINTGYESQLLRELNLESISNTNGDNKGKAHADAGFDKEDFILDIHKNEELKALADAAAGEKKVHTMDPESVKNMRTKMYNEMYAQNAAIVQAMNELATVLNERQTAADTEQIQESSPASGSSQGSGNTKAGNSDNSLEALEASMPDEWTAEAVSSRIADFALSFRGAFKGDDSKFFNIIRDAVEQGFMEALEMLGSLPGPVGELAQKTYKLTMEKLDAAEAEMKAEGKNSGIPLNQAA